MSTCLACKSCTTGCPVKVDVPNIRSKFLSAYYGRYLRPIRHHLVSRLEILAPALSRVAILNNAVTATGVLKLLGLVHTPMMSTTSLAKDMKTRGIHIATPDALRKIAKKDRHLHVVIVSDVFTTYYDRQVLLDTCDLLAHLGFTPWLAPHHENGKAKHVHGFLKAFRKTAAKTAKTLNDLSATGVALVGIDPSMSLTFSAEYKDSVGHAHKPNVELLQDWLVRMDLPVQPASNHGPVGMLPHCSGKALSPRSLQNWRKVFHNFNIELETIPVGCCGMAGTFGHESENRSLSERIYKLSWAAPVKTHKFSEIIADGYSCRSQAKLMDNVKLLHPVQLLHQRLMKS